MARSYQFTSVKCDTFKLCLSSSPVKMDHHRHNELEFMYFRRTSGCTYRINDREITVRAGDLITANPWEYHRCDDFGGNPEVVCLIVNPHWLFFEATKELLFVNRIAARADIAAVFEGIVEVLLAEPEGGISQSALYRIAAKISELTAILCEVGIARRISSREREIQEILSYIDNNLARKLTMQELAGQMYISADRFYHVFKETVGISPGGYIMEARIQKARLLLSDTGHSITEIAQLCGFCTSSYFTVSFKKHLGLSPREYRNMAKKKNGSL